MSLGAPEMPAQPGTGFYFYSGFEFLVEVKDLYDNSEIFADAAHLFLSISPTGALG